MKTWVKVLLIVLGIIIVGGLAIFFMGTVKKGKDISSSPPPSFAKSTSDQAGFEAKKSSSYYTVYFHAGDDTNADKTLAVLDDAVKNYYQKYYGITPQATPVYLAQTVDEYVKIADFPGGVANVQVGDGSAPNGKIYLYKPFDDPQKGKGVIVHEGTHAAIYGFLGGGQNMEKFPTSLNEGMAYHVEFINNAGISYDPLKEIYYADLLKQSVKTGNPPLLSLDELGKNCEGYIADQNQNGLCRGQGTFTIWYMAKTYGNDLPAGEAGFWSKFLTDLKTSGDWQKSLEKISGKNISQISQEIDSSLKGMIK